MKYFTDKKILERRNAEQLTDEDILGVLDFAMKQAKIAATPNLHHTKRQRNMILSSMAGAMLFECIQSLQGRTK